MEAIYFKFFFIFVCPQETWTGNSVLEKVFFNIYFYLTDQLWLITPVYLLFNFVLWNILENIEKTYVSRLLLDVVLPCVLIGR